MPEFLSYRVVPIKPYPDKINGDPFFWFNGECVMLDLDNPFYLVPAQTD